MKKLLLTISAIICMFTTSQSQIMNGGFENWTFGLPDNWWGAMIPGYNVLSQSVNAHSGNSAVNLHIDTIAGQPFGTPLSTGNGTVTTHPLSFVPLSVSFWYELNAVGGDELTLTVLVYSGGSGVGVAAFTVPAAVNYTHIVQPILYGSIPASADSIALIFIITHASGTPHAGTDAYIDDVSVSASTGINNLTAGNSFQIMPNPAIDFFSVEFPSGLKTPSVIYLTDITGRLIYSHIVSDSEEKFNVTTTGLKQGVYYCIVKSGDLQSRKQLIIIHE